MKNDRQRVAFVCERCGSSDVVKDARATWDAYQQKWNLVGYYDSAECQTCEKETELIPVELAPLSAW